MAREVHGRRSVLFVRSIPVCILRPACLAPPPAATAVRAMAMGLRGRGGRRSGCRPLLGGPRTCGNVVTLAERQDRGGGELDKCKNKRGRKVT